MSLTAAILAQARLTLSGDTAPPELVVPWWIVPAFEWFSRQPVVIGLLALMFIDVFAGLFLAITRKTVSSTVSWRGMSKKAMVLLVILASAVLQQFVPMLPVLNMVSLFYTCTEALSILENAALAGIPLPAGLKETLIKLREQQRMMQEQKNQLPPPGAANVINVFPAATPGAPPVQTSVSPIPNNPPAPRPTNSNETT